jgi:hypothetical protein
MLATGIKSGIENRDINWSGGFIHFSRHWLNASFLVLAFGSSCLGKMYVVERQIKKESHSNPVIKNFECGPLAGFVAVVERNELKEVRSIFHCTKCDSLVVSASESFSGGSGFKFHCTVRRQAVGTSHSFVFYAIVAGT